VQIIQRGISNCFVAKLDPAGAALSYATFLGGQGIDLCRGISVDAGGDALVTGTTSSANFPVFAALQPALSGSYDAFLTRLNSAGDRLLFSTYLGGESTDEGNAITLDATGIVYVAGDTTSVMFPALFGAVQAQNRGSYDAFLCAIAADGSHLLWATYLGGSGSDSATSVSIASDGRLVIAGFTASQDFPTVSPIQNAFGGAFDAFVAVVEANGSALDFCSFIGGSGDDRAYGVASIATNELVVAGQILSGSVSYVQQPFLPTSAAQYDGFVAGIGYPTGNPVPLRFIPIPPCRVSDTRAGFGFAGALGPPFLAASAIRNFPVLSSSCGIPTTAQAYSLNITVVPHGRLHWLTVWPTGQTLPNVSTLNSDGRIKANAAIVPAGIGGSLSIYASDPTDLVLDINGYFVAAANQAALAFYPLPVCRVADTRSAPGVLGGPSMTATIVRTFPILAASGCGIPSRAQAYSLNFTAYPSGGLDYITTWPAGQARPNASTLNAKTGTATSAAAILPAGTEGSISVYASNNTDLSIDINGYFAAAGPGGMSLYTVTPCRVVDTRDPAPQPPLPGGSTTLVAVGAGACMPVNAAQVYVLNSTVVPSGPLQYLTIWGEGTLVSTTPVLIAYDGAITSNMVIVAASVGFIEAAPSNPSYLILDLTAYFAP
jgi:hypothetical protein